MIPRKAEKITRTYLRGFPIVVITGPRQSGKTTLATKVFSDKPYYSLEEPDNREFAKTDPRGFLDRMQDGGVIDEIQRVPELLSYLQTNVDLGKKTGKFIITGSQNILLMSQITQSLAGRAGFIELLPLQFSEVKTALSKKKSIQIDEILFKGFYPSIYDRKVDPYSWYSSYIKSYIERDVRQLINVKDMDAFQRFLKLCAGRAGSVLNYSGIAVDSGVSQNTVKSWISVLETSYVLFQLQPFFKNYNKRLIKSPKLYFHDTGILCWLLGIQTLNHLSTHPMRGFIFENFIVSERIKSKLNQGIRPSLYYFRDNNGLEIDLIEEVESKIRAIEIKSGKTVHPEFLKNLLSFQNISKNETADSILVYSGDESYKRSKVMIQGWQDFLNEK